MRSLCLNEWLPKKGRNIPWRPKDSRSGPEEHLAKMGLDTTPLSESVAEATWTRLADKASRKMGIDVVESSAQSWWEGFGESSVRIEKTALLASTKEAFVLLFEEYPTLGYVIERRQIRVDEVRSTFYDLCLAPWPRLSWVAMLDHEGYGPFLLDLK